MGGKTYTHTQSLRACYRKQVKSIQVRGWESICVSTFIAGESVLTSQRTAPGSVQQSPKDSAVTGLSSLAGLPEFMLPGSDHRAS